MLTLSLVHFGIFSDAKSIRHCHLSTVSYVYLLGWAPNIHTLLLAVVAVFTLLAPSEEHILQAGDVFCPFRVSLAAGLHIKLSSVDCVFTKMYFLKHSFVQFDELHIFVFLEAYSKGEQIISRNLKTNSITIMNNLIV